MAEAKMPVKKQKWTIVCKPEGRNPGGPKGKSKDKGKNEGGMIILLKRVDTSYGTAEEVARVAFERKNGLYPNVPFEEQLRVEHSKATAAVELLNEQLAGSGELH